MSLFKSWMLALGMAAGAMTLGASAQQFDPSNPFQPTPGSGSVTPGALPPQPPAGPPSDGGNQAKAPDALAPSNPFGTGPGTGGTPPGRLVGNGSGFAINDDGAIVTNDHVIQGCRRLANPELGQLTVVARDATADLALLDAAAAPAALLALRRDGEVRLGDEIIVLGFPLQQYLAPQLNLTQGIVSSLAGLGGDLTLLQITAPVQPGNSGGPLLDMSGNVGGVVVSRLDGLRVASETGALPENVNFAIKLSELRGFLDANGVAYDERASSAPLTAADLAETYAEAVVVIECYQ